MFKVRNTYVLERYFSVHSKAPAVRTLLTASRKSFEPEQSIKAKTKILSIVKTLAAHANARIKHIIRASFGSRAFWVSVGFVELVLIMSRQPFWWLAVLKLLKRKKFCINDFTPK